MTSGFDPQTFRLHRIPAPSWASTDQTISPALPATRRTAAADQHQDILLAAERILQWALTDPEATARFQNHHPFASDATGAYFIGRQLLDQDPEHPDRILVETECCLTHLDYQGLPAVDHRYIVILSWDPSARQAETVLIRGTPRQSRLAELPLSLIRTRTVEDIPDVTWLEDEGRAHLVSSWADVLACVRQAAQEIVDDSTASGALDEWFFPARIDMTGDYSVGQARSLDAGRVLLTLHFTARQRMTSRGEDDYLGYELEVNVGDRGPLAYVLWGSQVIG
ncbi:hypothetical protein [Deinococcus radiotolerans]|uniref:hypothetical protein n=1 Tax=Deinococcus radiotolerans TaxID=1309407 RepID=UPI00166544BE|nr:hypothetical protein [Deinococcus radiotolerans]